MEDATPPQAENAGPGKNFLAAIVADERILLAWPCASYEEALGWLRRWYAVRRLVDRRNCGDSWQERARYEVEPSVATLTEISSWWCDGTKGYFATISEIDSTDPLAAALDEHQGAAPEELAEFEEELRAELARLASPNPQPDRP